MTTERDALLLNVAGFLRLVHEGFPVSRAEAGELLEAIGAALAAPKADDALRTAADAVSECFGVSDITMGGDQYPKVRAHPTVLGRALYDLRAALAATETGGDE